MYSQEFVSPSFFPLKFIYFSLINSVNKTQKENFAPCKRLNKKLKEKKRVMKRLDKIKDER